MAFEMICGQCRGNLLVEQFGVVVACPHCGAHLHIPAPADQAPPAPAPVPAPPEPTPLPEPVAAQVPIPPEPPSESVEPPPAPLTEEIRAFNGGESEPPPSVEISVAPSIEVSVEPEPQATDSAVAEETAARAAGEGGFSLSTLLAASVTEEAVTAPAPVPVETPPADVGSQTVVTEAAASVESTLPAESVPAQATSEPAAVSVTATEPSVAPSNDAAPSGLSGLFGSSATSTDEAVVAAEQPSSEAIASTQPETMTEEVPVSEEHPETSSLVESDSAVVPAAATIKPASNDRVTVSKMMLVVLLSYASAMTLGFGWLLYQIKTGRVGGDSLESLPDPVPVKTTGFHWYSPKTPMTAGHELKIGDTQRFGNIKVTVVKVTRGPIQFRHFSDPSQTRPPSLPVLKLWLKFENVSDDQEIAPLDDQLLFRRFGRNFFEYKSSQFVCRADEKKMRNPRFVVAYDHIIGSGWDLAGLPLDKPLAPHESREYYVPTCEHGIDDLTGDLVWRVQIRKGYSSRGNGVTTLFEVHFDSQDIRNEPA